MIGKWGPTLLFLFPLPTAVTCHPAVALSAFCVSPSTHTHTHTHQGNRADAEVDLCRKTKAKVGRRASVKNLEENSHKEEHCQSFPEPYKNLSWWDFSRTYELWLYIFDSKSYGENIIKTKSL